MFENDDVARGYLAGIIDGEGSVSDGSRSPRGVRITNTDFTIIDAAKQALDQLGIAYSERWRDDRERRDNVFGTKPICDLIMGRRELLEKISAEVPLQCHVKAERLARALASYRATPPYERVKELMEQGLGYRAIAAILGVPASTAQLWTTKVDTPRRKPGRPKGSLWSEEERETRNTKTVTIRYGDREAQLQVHNNYFSNGGLNNAVVLVDALEACGIDWQKIHAGREIFDVAELRKTDMVGVYDLTVKTRKVSTPNTGKTNT